ncbi:protein NPAT isoform X2 [Pleurodeles waltl]|uniref:protein NPAT isoform X2 n=1 Tax=Pleurodeles waltl TaxID=8319 RepID=UPI003709AC50
MLLPSDIARLVLGYLQQEKLASTCSAFIAESPDLKEYAEHYTDEGFVPGCLLSLFGKNLTTILNEYVSMKAKETTSEVPAMVSSLWKRLEYTLSQIRSMQNSAAYSAHQRARTRCGIADMRRQRMLESLTASSSSQQLGPSASNPSVAKPLIVRCALQAKSNPLFAGSSGTLENKMASDHGGKSTSTAVVCQKDGRHAHLMSPGRRKSESQRKRPHLTDKNIESSSFVLLDEQNDPLQELIDGNFPKMVIENAREKFLSNKSLQEKLAENINKFLGSDIAQASRPADSSAVDTDNAIDEILGLEGGEIHMSDEAIQDILQQTESDPAFQALFDLFDYGKHKDDRKTTEVACTHPEDIVNDSTLEEDCPDSVKTSLPLDSVSGKDVTNATRNSSTENEVSVNNITEKNTRPDAFENSLDKDGHNHGKHVSSEKVCNAVTKHPDNSVEKEEISKPTLVVLNMEHEKEKLDQGLLDVENNKQVCTIQTVATPEHDRPDSDHLQSPMDEGKSPGRKPPATPISPMVETHSAIVIETEKESSVSEHFTPNEQSLPGFGLTKPGVPEHSQVTSNVEMEDISSSKGSTIIFASPVQPAMLQMGMIPLSVVGQNRNAYSAYPGQLLRMPAASPLGSRGMAKQPILPKNQKPIGSKSTIHTGRISKRKEDTLNHPPLFQPPRSETSDTVLPSEEQTKPEDNALLAPPSAPNANTKVGGSHRRVLCFEDGTSALEKASGQVPKPPTTPQNKERLDSLLHSLQAAVGASQYIKIMQSTDSNKVESNPPVVESSGMQSGVTGSRVASSSVKDADTGQRVAQSGASLDFHGNTSANKENKLRGSKEQQQKHDSPKFTASQEHNTFYDKTVPLVKEMSRKGILPNILRKSPHDPRKEVGKSHLISPLSKQAGEMLQDIQMRSPAPMQVDSGDLPLPRTPGSGMGILDCVRTPTCKNSSEEVGTPRALFLPATPELQGCSPASEAGSENSVSMAAHTLMILSRASIANTGSTTPLKDNTQQIKSRSTTKKRKLEETEECDRQTRLSKKETQSPPTPLKKKKIKKQKKKKLLDSFPAGMDVDKFLLSLHYDE